MPRGFSYNCLMLLTGYIKSKIWVGKNLLIMKLKLKKLPGDPQKKTKVFHPDDDKKYKGCGTMEIGRFHVQHILRVYSQQLSLRSRESKEKISKKLSQNDEVTISPESRKRMMVDKMASELMAQLANGSERNETGREILDRLSKEYGRPLDVEANNGDGLAFKVLDDKGQESVQYLPPAENDQLNKKLFDITRSVVYDHFI